MLKLIPKMVLNCFSPVLVLLPLPPKCGLSGAISQPRWAPQGHTVKMFPGFLPLVRAQNLTTGLSFVAAPQVTEDRPEMTQTQEKGLPNYNGLQGAVQVLPTWGKM